MLHDYLFPISIEAALAILHENGGRARIIAGGTDLILQQARRHEKSAVFVDLSKIPSLNVIEKRSGWLVLGANVTHGQAASSPLVRAEALALALASGKVGGRQIRNIATVVGNVVSGQPAADAAVALTALEARCVLTGPNGRSRELTMQEMYVGVGRSVVDSTSEILTHIRIPLNAGEASSYMRMEQRKALSLPMLCVAAKLSVANGVIKKAKLSIAPVGPGPQRALEAEEFLHGKVPGRSVFSQAAGLAGKQATFRSSSVRGSKEFRQAVLPVFVVRALEAAAGRV